MKTRDLLPSLYTNFYRRYQRDAQNAVSYDSHFSSIIRKIEEKKMWQKNELIFLCNLSPT